MRVGGRWRVLLVLVLLAACSGGGEDEAAERNEPEASEGREDEQDEQATGDAEALAEEWLDDWRRLDETTRASLQATRTVASRGVTHVHFGQQFDGIGVRGAEVVVHVLDDGTVQGATDSLVDARPPGDAEAEVDEEAARDIAGKAVPGEVAETKSARQVWLPDGESLRLGWSVLMSTDERRGAWTIWVDAITGEVADAKQVTTDRTGVRAQAAEGCDLDDEEEPAACVFLPDPIYASGGDILDADDANRFLDPEPLLGLDDPDSGALVGEFVDLEPEVSPVDPVRDPDGRWEIGRGEDGFEAVMAYYWIDRAQRLFQELGFDDVRNESFGVVPVDPGTLDNAFYTPAEQVVVLGVGSDGVNEGEDASGILHEYGHAVLDAQVPNMLLNEEGRAYHEAFGDLLAYFVSLEFRQGDAECLFAWAEAGECLRRVDTDKVIPDDLVQEEHLDGEIFTGAVHDVFQALLDAEDLTVASCTGPEGDTDVCPELRDRMVATLLGANEFLTPAATLADAATAFRLANEAAFDGADAELLDDAFAAHGFDEGSSAIVGPDGEPTVDAPAASVAIDISHDFRGDLRVLVGVADADFEDLCEAIAVVEPDPEDAADNVVGRIDVSDSDCAAFLPPGPDQQWILFVEDTEPEDEGVINSFRVFDDDTAFLATGVPRPIADDDPTGSAVIVNGSGRAVEQEGTEEVGGDGATGEPAVALAIEHPFVGDLFIRVGVADADGDVLCSIPVQDPDPTDGSADLEGTVAAGECATHFPPAGDRRWFLEVIDTAEADAGTITAFAVLDENGRAVAEGADLPVDIPDNEEGGVTVVTG